MWRYWGLSWRIYQKTTIMIGLALKWSARCGRDLNLWRRLDEWNRVLGGHRITFWMGTQVTNNWLKQCDSALAHVKISQSSKEAKIKTLGVVQSAGSTCRRRKKGSVPKAIKVAITMWAVTPTKVHHDQSICCSRCRCCHACCRLGPRVGEGLHLRLEGRPWLQVRQWRNHEEVRRLCQEHHGVCCCWPCPKEADLRWGHLVVRRGLR